MVKRPDYLVRNAKSLRKNQTPWEIKLWKHLRAGRLAGLKFKRQVPVEKYIVDFCCNERKIIVELDGSGHINSLRDKMRDKLFSELGYNVLRFWNNDIDNNFEAVLDKIRLVINAKKK